VVRLDSTSRLQWLEEIVLGRHGEDPGTWESNLRVEVDGKPLVASSTSMGPASPHWGSSATFAGARCFVGLVVVDRSGQTPTESTPPCGPEPAATVQGEGIEGMITWPEMGPAAVVSVWGDGLAKCRREAKQLVSAHLSSPWMIDPW
jgi:urease accessory protein